MTWLKQWLSTAQEWALLIVGAPVAIWGVVIACRKLLKQLNAMYRGGLFLLDLEEMIGGMDRNISMRLDRLEEGQQNIIQVRRGIMEEDRQKAWVETDANGKFTWANRLWREFTGIESDHVRGHGWEAGIENSDRDEFLRQWESATDHQRSFESRVTLVNRMTGKTTEVRFSAWPIRNENTVVSYLGHATSERHKA